MHSETTSYTSSVPSSRNSIIIRASSSSDDDDDDHDDNQTDSEYDTSSDSDTEEYDTIHQEDSAHFYSEKEDGTTYIGLAHRMPKDAHIIMSNTVSAQTYFQYPHNTIVQYLYAYGIVRIHRPILQVMTLNILTDGTYSMILKTYWIRLVQRHWRRTYRKRCVILRHRANPHIRKLFEINGRYPYPLDKMPSAYGMLSVYAKNS